MMMFHHFVRCVYRSSTTTTTNPVRSLLLGSTFVVAVVAGTTTHSSSTGYCQERSTTTTGQSSSSSSTTTTNKKEEEEEDENSDYFFEYFPMSQLYQPKRPYPAWDNNWDGNEEETNNNNNMDVPTSSSSSSSSNSNNNNTGVTRHMIFIRHGQYHETQMEDEKCMLTDLGRKQAHLTGKRIAEMIQGYKEQQFQPCPIGILHVSDMTRAKETANIIASYLPNHIVRSQPDPLLNEGMPAQIIPPRRDVTEELAEHGERIEEAFQKYFYRITKKNNHYYHNNNKDNNNNNNHHHHPNDAETINTTTTATNITNNNNNMIPHQFEIIVCHGNVIRYFFTRALQLPPEAWLRMSIFNCSLTYFMIKPNGTVTCRMLGDIGHLGYNHCTFSMNPGFVWS